MTPRRQAIGCAQSLRGQGQRSIPEDPGGDPSSRPRSERKPVALPARYGCGAGGGGGAAYGGAGGAGGIALGGGGGPDEGGTQPGGGGGGMATQVPRDGVCTTAGIWLFFAYMH